MKLLQLFARPTCRMRNVHSIHQSPNLSRCPRPVAVTLTPLLIFFLLFLFAKKWFRFMRQLPASVFPFFVQQLAVCLKILFAFIRGNSTNISFWPLKLKFCVFCSARDRYFACKSSAFNPILCAADVAVARWVYLVGLQKGLLLLKKYSYYNECNLNKI